MNRRSFFKTALAAVVAVVAAPGLKLLPKVASRTAIARKRGPSAAELEFWRNRKLPGFNFYDLQAHVQPLYPEVMKEFAAKRSGGGNSRQRRAWRRAWTPKKVAA